MNIRALLEVTEWNKDHVGYDVPNHIYLVSGFKCYGYIKEGERKAVFFKGPIFFDKKFRTFKDIGEYTRDVL
jgi:hypothetical protein